MRENEPRSARLYEEKAISSRNERALYKQSSSIYRQVPQKY